ncbi:Clr5 domain-containing protein [Microdochium nivale]|nr:Clr5 domain-containing protein [Microdochium nivale]
MSSRLPTLAPKPFPGNGQAQTTAPASAAQAPRAAKQHHGAAEWARLKPIIRELFFVGEMKIKDVAQVLEIDHNFKTSLRSLQIRLDEWGYNKKLTKPAMKILIAKEDERKSRGKDTAFTLHGSHMKPERLATFRKRFANEYDPRPPPDAATPDGIEYSTPLDLRLEDSPEGDPAWEADVEQAEFLPATGHGQCLDPMSDAMKRLYPLFINGDGAWSFPVIDKSSIPGPDDTRIALQPWMGDSTNSHGASSVFGVLKSWAAKHSIAFFNLGLQVSLSEKEYSQTATLISVALHLQKYHYFTNEGIEEYRELSGFPVSIDGHEYNSLLCCEATGPKGNLPNIRRFPFTSNLAEPKGPRDEGEVLGIFVLSHHLYLEEHILPMLRDLSRAIQVIPLEPEMGLTESGGDIFRPRFAFGSDPSDYTDKSRLPNSGANRGNMQDNFFDWRPRDGQPGYQWYDKVDAYGSNTAIKDYGAMGYKKGPFYRKWTIWSEMGINITWDKGDNCLRVSGRTHYNHKENYSADFGWSRYFWGNFNTDVTWSFRINLAVPKELKNDKNKMNGVIEPMLMDVDASFLPKDFSAVGFVFDGTHKRISNAIREMISTAIKNVATQIAAKFAGTGRFYYPGVQELDFGEPRLTQQGDVIATIKYKP